jgi:hypothetical protein
MNFTGFVDFVKRVLPESAKLGAYPQISQMAAD